MHSCELKECLQELRIANHLFVTAKGALAPPCDARLQFEHATISATMSFRDLQLRSTQSVTQASGDESPGPELDFAASRSDSRFALSC